MTHLDNIFTYRNTIQHLILTINSNFEMEANIIMIRNHERKCMNNQTYTV